MASVFDLLDRLGPAGIVLQAIGLTGAGIGGLLAFILVRRAWRGRNFRRRDARVVVIRARLDAIIDGDVPADEWRRDPLDAEIVETLVLDSLERAGVVLARRLSRCLRRSGLLDARIHDARVRRGWRRRQALNSLARMKASEAVPALAEALEARSSSTVMAAIRALGRVGAPGAAKPLLDYLVGRTAALPTIPVQNAVIGACRAEPDVIVPYLDRAKPELRRLLARVLCEIARSDMTEVLLLLASDPEAEVRASAARLLADAPLDIALPVLNGLTTDDEWFVRLRAIVALGQLQHERAIPGLVRGLCDRHRFVRLRAARGLATMEEHLAGILDEVEATGDRYALQSLLSELELSGVVMRHVERLNMKGTARTRAVRLITRIVDLGARRLIISALVEHNDSAIQDALARLLPGCDPGALVPLVDRALARDPDGDARVRLERVRASLTAAPLAVAQ